MGNTINVTTEISEITVVDETLTVNVTPEEYTIEVGDGPRGFGVAPGGLEGQILAKATNDDYDTEWIDNDAYRVIEVVKCGVPVTKGQAVYVTGATGANVIVGLAQADTDAKSSKTLAIAAESGATNDFIKVVLVGAVEDINTASAVAGDPVWLSPTTAGGLLFGVANKPSAPNHLVYMGVVVRAHANQGVIQVHIVNGFELEELHNVSISSPSNGQVLTYNGSLWVNSAPAGDITAVTVSSPITGGGSSGSVAIGFDQAAQDSTNDARYARLGAANAFTVGGHTITNNAVGTVPLRINAIASQTARSTEWYDPSGSLQAYVTGAGDVKGRLLFAYTTTNMSASLNVGTASAASIGAVIRGQASQSANLQEWQDSAGTVLASVNPVGSILFSNSGSLLSGSNGRGLFITNAAATVPMTVRGAASQTANLQEWQNSSGTILAYVNPSGIIEGAQVRVSNNYVRMSIQNNGGALMFGRQTAAAANPGANYATLYFRDGTNANTLKLVVRAGAAGAETTILDNIPT